MLSQTSSLTGWVIRPDHFQSPCHQQYTEVGRGPSEHHDLHIFDRDFFINVVEERWRLRVVVKLMRIRPDGSYPIFLLFSEASPLIFVESGGVDGLTREEYTYGFIMVSNSMSDASFEEPDSVLLSIQICASMSVWNTDVCWFFESGGSAGKKVEECRKLTMLINGCPTLNPSDGTSVQAQFQSQACVAHRPS